jgi:hypothetical protein
MLTELYVFEQNVVFGWLTILLHIREVPGSDYASEASCPDGGFRGFPQALQVNARIMY